MMKNGRVTYLSWEYTNMPHFFYRILFSMNPDDTNQTAVYGSNSHWPNSLFYAKPIPGNPERFVGRHETEGVFQSILGREDVVENEIQDYLYQNRWFKFLQIDPLGASNEDCDGRNFLVIANRA